MVIRGGTRGNGKQLANYLLTQGENEKIEILDIDRRDNNSAAFLKKTLLSMSLTSELTKSDKGLYHSVINPAYGEDVKMTRADWEKAADMLGEALELQDQRRVIVLHTKKGRTHAHVVWERYDHERGIMVSDSFSRYAQDKARQEMEKVFEQRPTPKRNPHRPDMKKDLSRLWEETKTAAAFVSAAEKEGYTFAKGMRRPFTVIDQQGIAFDLVRQLDGVNTKQVRERFGAIALPDEKAALVARRSRQLAATFDRLQEGMSDAIAVQQELTAIKDEQKAQSLKMAKDFSENKQNTTTPDTEPIPHPSPVTPIDENKADVSDPQEPSAEEIEAMKRKVLEDLKAMRERQRQQRQGPRRRGPQ